jgi:hypothetical protein
MTSKEKIMTTMILKRAARQIVLTGLAILGFTGVCFAQPAVKLGTSSGPPTTTVLVSGSGFAADALIDIYFDTTDEVLALANGSGAFSKIALVVPASAQPGAYSGDVGPSFRRMAGQDSG